MKIVLLPAPDGPTMATVSPRATSKLTPLRAETPGRDGIGEAHVAERDACRAAAPAAAWAARGARDLGPRRQQLHQPLGGAGGLRQLAPHLGQLGHGAGREHRIEHELAEPAAGHLAADHQARAEPQHADDARDDQEDGDRGQAGAGQQARARRRERALDGGGEAAATRSPPGRRRAMARTAPRFSAA